MNYNNYCCGVIALYNLIEYFHPGYGSKYLPKIRRLLSIEYKSGVVNRQIDRALIKLAYNYQPEISIDVYGPYKNPMIDDHTMDHATKVYYIKYMYDLIQYHLQNGCAAVYTYGQVNYGHVVLLLPDSTNRGLYIVNGDPEDACIHITWRYFYTHFMMGKDPDMIWFITNKPLRKLPKPYIVQNMYVK